jgi:hypothetical protein
MPKTTQSTPDYPQRLPQPLKGKPRDKLGEAVSKHTHVLISHNLALKSKCVIVPAKHKIIKEFFQTLWLTQMEYCAKKINK